jgi:hypothetical protein
VPPIRLEDLQTGVVVELFAGEGVADVSADVKVADAPGVRIAMCPLPNLC